MPPSTQSARGCAHQLTSSGELKPGYQQCLKCNSTLDVLPDGSVVVAMESVISRALAQLREENVALRAKIAAARIRLHPGHPAYKQLADDDVYQEHP